MKNFFKTLWSKVMKIFGIVKDDIKCSLKKFWEKHGFACVCGAMILFIGISWFLSGVCGVHVTSVVGNTVLFFLTLLGATVIGLLEVEGQDGFIATGDWSALAVEITLLSPFIALSNMYELWALAAVAVFIMAVWYFVFAMFRRVWRYVLSVIKRI